MCLKSLARGWSGWVELCQAESQPTPSSEAATRTVQYGTILFCIGFPVKARDRNYKLPVLPPRWSCNEEHCKNLSTSLTIEHHYFVTIIHGRSFIEEPSAGPSHDPSITHSFSILPDSSRWPKRLWEATLLSTTSTMTTLTLVSDLTIGLSELFETQNQVGER